MTDPIEPAASDPTANVIPGGFADNAPILCWMGDASGSLYWYNDNWYSFTGTTPESMKGWGWAAVHHPKVLGDVLARWVTCLRTGKTFEMIFPIRRADGVFVPFLTRSNPVEVDGKITGWFGVNTEISELLSGPLATELASLSAKMAA